MNSTWGQSPLQLHRTQSSLPPLGQPAQQSRIAHSFSVVSAPLTFAGRVESGDQVTLQAKEDSDKDKDTSKGQQNPGMNRWVATGIGSLLGGLLGCVGLVGGPLAAITIPAGILLGALIGFLLANRDAAEATEQNQAKPAQFPPAQNLDEAITQYDQKIRELNNYFDQNLKDDTEYSLSKGMKILKQMEEGIEAQKRYTDDKARLLEGNDLPSKAQESENRMTSVMAILQAKATLCLDGFKTSIEQIGDAGNDVNVIYQVMDQAWPLVEEQIESQSFALAELHQWSMKEEQKVSGLFAQGLLSQGFQAALNAWMGNMFLASAYDQLDWLLSDENGTAQAERTKELERLYLPTNRTDLNSLKVEYRNRAFDGAIEPLKESIQWLGKAEYPIDGTQVPQFIIHSGRTSNLPECLKGRLPAVVRPSDGSKIPWQPILGQANTLIKQMPEKPAEQPYPWATILLRVAEQSRFVNQRQHIVLELGAKGMLFPTVPDDYPKKTERVGEIQLKLGQMLEPTRFKIIPSSLPDSVQQVELRTQLDEATDTASVTYGDWLSFQTFFATTLSENIKPLGLDAIEWTIGSDISEDSSYFEIEQAQEENERWIQNILASVKGAPGDTPANPDLMLALMNRVRLDIEKAQAIYQIVEAVTNDAQVPGYLIFAPGQKDDQGKELAAMADVRPGQYDSAQTGDIYANRDAVRELVEATGAPTDAQKGALLAPLRDLRGSSGTLDQIGDILGKLYQAP